MKPAPPKCRKALSAMNRAKSALRKRKTHKHFTAYMRATHKVEKACKGWY